MNKRNSTLPLVCLICGDVACGINFNVRSCGSCKIFFRRHKTSPQVRKQIDFHWFKYEICISFSKILRRKCWKENNCEITPYTRSHCSACRLKKCFACGMDPEIIGSHGSIIQKNQKLLQVSLSIQTILLTIFYLSSRVRWIYCRMIIQLYHGKIGIFCQIFFMLMMQSIFSQQLNNFLNLIPCYHWKFVRSQQ